MDRGQGEKTGRAHKHILVVCYGNICRSPVAEELLRQELSKANLEERYSVSSAGVQALVGRGAASGMIAAAASRGLSLSEHRAQQLTPDMARAADVVIALDEIVEEEILILTGDGIEVELWPVDDPYGGPEKGYAKALVHIEQHVQEYLNGLRAQTYSRD